MASKNTHRRDVSAFFINPPMARLIRKREKVSAFIACTPVFGLAWRFSVCWALPGVSAIRPFIGWSHPREVCQENKSRLLREKIMDEAGERRQEFLLQLWRSQPILWDIRNVNYRKVHLKKGIWDKMSQELRCGWDAGKCLSVFCVMLCACSQGT